MSEEQYDFLVVGSGPGGQRAALSAAENGKRVALIERKPYLGGVSLQTGTVPSKALREAAFLASRFGSRGMRGSVARGFAGDRGFLGEAVRTKDRVIDQQASQLLGDLMRAGITIVPGEASFVDAHTLEILGRDGRTRRLRGDYIVLAAGSRPRRPADIPFDKERVLDSSSILKLQRLPESMVVVGGGVIACEFATMLAPLGTRVTLIDSHAQLLAYLDDDVAAILAQQMEDMGIELYMDTRLTAIERDGDRVRVQTDSQGELEADRVLYALGRQPNYDNLAIERAGLVADDRGWVRVNEHQQTPVDHIYIVGDLAGRPSLASTAMAQGRRAVAHACGKPLPVSEMLLPMAIYTIPELSYVGETEKEVRERGVEYVTGCARYGDTARGHIIGDERGMLKLLVERESRKLLGAHIIGESASELIHVAQLQMASGMLIDSLAATVFNYPTLAECYKLASQKCVRALDAN